MVQKAGVDVDKLIEFERGDVAIDRLAQGGGDRRSLRTELATRLAPRARGNSARVWLTKLYGQCASVIAEDRSRTCGRDGHFGRLRYGVWTRWIEDRRRQCRGAIECGAAERPTCVILESRARRDIRMTRFGDQNACGDHSPKHNPGQEKKLRHGCFGSNHGFSPLTLFVSSQKDRRKELV